MPSDLRLPALVCAGPTMAQIGSRRHDLGKTGSAYWRGLVDWLASAPLQEGTIWQRDLDLLTVTDDPAHAVQVIVDANGPVA